MLCGHHPPPVGGDLGPSTQRHRQAGSVPRNQGDGAQGVGRQQNLCTSQPGKGKKGSMLIYSGRSMDAIINKGHLQPSSPPFAPALPHKTGQACRTARKDAGETGWAGAAARLSTLLPPPPQAAAALHLPAAALWQERPACASVSAPLSSSRALEPSSGSFPRYCSVSSFSSRPLPVTACRPWRSSLGRRSASNPKLSSSCTHHTR
jgi:hypothetical protein